MLQRQREENKTKILCARVCKWKMIPVETTLGIGEEGNKGE
jgi:hypothetical protein